MIALMLIYLFIYFMIALMLNDNFVKFLLESGPHFSTKGKSQAFQ